MGLLQKNTFLGHPEHSPKAASTIFPFAFPDNNDNNITDIGGINTLDSTNNRTVWNNQYEH